MIAMIATRSPINHVTGVFKLSILASTYDFIRVSDAPISLLTSSFDDQANFIKVCVGQLSEGWKSNRS